MIINFQTGNKSVTKTETGAVHSGPIHTKFLQSAGERGLAAPVAVSERRMATDKRGWEAMRGPGRSGHHSFLVGDEVTRL